MALKLASALDATVTIACRTPDKAADEKKIGADALLLPTDNGPMDKAAPSFDLIIDTASVRHDFEPVTSCRWKTIRVSPA
jgi:uncharacterized zinc-type alcohol dehydrogenase-like protein